MCVLSIKVPIRKKSGNLSYALPTNIFFCIVAPICRWRDVILYHYNIHISKIILVYFKAENSQKKYITTNNNTFTIYNIRSPWGLSSLAKELSATVSVMQGSSKELSSLEADRVWKNVNKGCCCCMLKYKIPKNSRSQRSPLVAEWSEA